ncbi:MAG: hypothetical protein ACTHOP_22145 [Mesorhizobium sp.]
MAAERKEAVRAWALTDVDGNIDPMLVYDDYDRACEARDVFFDRRSIIEVEIRPAPTGEGQ